MGTITGAVRRVVRSGRGLLPSGQLLTPKVWERRHRGIVWLLWLHVAGLAAFAVVRGYGLLHGLQEASLVAAFAVPAAHPAFARRARSAAAVLGLITASAVLVHLSGGVVEAHFHFFVMIGVITSTRTGCRSGWPSAMWSSTTPCSGCWPRPRCSTTRRPSGPPGSGP
jgi:hypothetical protein